MAETEIGYLRREFHAHEQLDESRHVATTGRLTALEVAQADLKGYIRGRSAVLAVLLAVVIPILTEIVSAIFAPHNGVTR